MTKPDQPNSPRHAHLKAQWKPGQKWETLVDGASIWVPVSEGGFAEPLWDHNQEYRQALDGDGVTPHSTTSDETRNSAVGKDRATPGETT